MFLFYTCNCFVNIIYCIRYVTLVSSERFICTSCLYKDYLIHFVLCMYSEWAI